MTYSIDNDDIAHETVLEWTTEPPTVGGWYWAIHEYEGLTVIRLVATIGSADFIAYIAGVDYAFIPSGFTHWLGPLPTPKPPQE